MNFIFIKNLLFLMLFPLLAISQNISVKSFKKLPHSLDAKTYYPKEDQNGDKSALIKIVTTEKGFKWEGDGLGIVSTEYKTGEYWVYVPYGAKRLTIKHPDLGIVRDYPYPISIKKATVYELVLTTGKVITSVVDYVPETQWLVIKSDPPGASVYLNEEYKGETPFQREMLLGSYVFRLEYPMYSTTAGKVELIEANGKKSLTYTLKPNFTSLSVNSKPEGGATVFVDGKSTGKTTPCVIEKVGNGEHIISLKHKWYSPIKQNITVGRDNKPVIITMKPNFAIVKVITDAESNVYFDGSYETVGSTSKRLASGFHTIDVKKESHTTISKKIQIIIGKDQVLELHPVAQKGTLKIMSTPMDATVILNGKNYGVTPITIPNLLIGVHEIVLKIARHKTIKKQIIISENKTLSLNETFEKVNETKIINRVNLNTKKQSITPVYKILIEVGEFIITSSPSNASVYLNDEFKGNTPVRIVLNKQKYSLKIVKDNLYYESELNINYQTETNLSFNLSQHKDSN